jgi:hypothetical protein
VSLLPITGLRHSGYRQGAPVSLTGVSRQFAGKMPALPGYTGKQLLTDGGVSTDAKQILFASEQQSAFDRDG